MDFKKTLLVVHIEEILTIISSLRRCIKKWQRGVVLPYWEGGPRMPTPTLVILEATS